MPDIKSNEREFTGQVISWLNEFIRKGSYPFEVASSEHSLKVKEKTKFPDVQIWLNRKAKQGFCGWELKTPSTQVDDQETLNNAAEKARAMHADYFVTWNMRDAVIWRTPHWTEEVSRIHRLKTYSSITQVSTPDDLWVVFKQELLKAKASELLNDLAILQREGHLHLIEVDSVFFVHKLSEAVKTLWPHIHKSLISEVGKSSEFKNGLFNWAVKQGIAKYEAGEIFFESVSRQIVYRLLGKVLFYLTLRRFRTDIPKLDLHGIQPTKASEKLKEYFEIARQIDYQAVFEDDFPDTVPFPPNALEPLRDLLDDLNRYNLSHMPQDVVGNVFEQLIPPEERHALGQYFTNESLVDLITAFCVKTMYDKILDPTCGTGTFLIRAYDRLKNAGEKDHLKRLSQIWGIDIAHFPAELATINLYRQNIENYANFPRVISRDFFEVNPGDSFKFPPPKPPTGENYTIEEKIPPFDAVVGNFPYIRQELIEKRLKGYKDKLGNVLQQDWMQDYREFFDEEKKPKLSGQADIYAYLFFHTARHLKEGGRMGIVTSNSWLDVAYGYELQKFFLKNFKIIAIFESRCEPWFEDAAVNTVVTILERCKEKDKRDANNVKFVKIKRRLKDLIPWDMKLSMQRWSGLDRLIHTIETAGEGSYVYTHQKKKSKNSATHEDDNFRIRIIKQSELLEKVDDAGKTVKWGQYLRAPEIYFEILDKCKDTLAPVKQIANVTRGVTTNNVDFFYLKKDIIDHWGIEKKHLNGPVIYSPKEVPNISIDTKLLERFLFVCNYERKKLTGTNALNYIKWGESKKYNSSLTFKGKEDWYAIREVETEPCSLYYARQDVAYRVVYNPDGLIVNDNLYRITPKVENYNKLLCGILNSALFYLGLEINGRINLGDGALKVQAYEIDLLPVINIEEISQSQKQSILKAFDKLLTRPVKPIFEEVKMKDRQVLDSAVLEALGLDPGKYLKPLYDGLTDMVRERIDLAKSRKKIKQAKTQKDVEKLKEQVIEEIIPDGVKKFPEEFIDSKHLKDAKEISVPGEPLKLGSYFMGQQEVVSDGGFKYEAGNLDEAKFIVYAQKPDSFIIKIPTRTGLLANAVTGYEKYLKDLKAKLFEAIFSRTLDHKQADMLTNQVFEELGLPDI